MSVTMASEPVHPRDDEQGVGGAGALGMIESLRAPGDDGGAAAPAPLPSVRARVLVVDDDRMNLDFLERRLARKGYEVASASGGEEALRVIEQRAGGFDLILLDILMPVVSGIDVLQRLRLLHGPADLPVIMVTALNQSDDIVQALKLGANDYVTKPLDFNVVMARVETQLGLKRARDEVKRLAVELELRNRFIRKTFGRYLSHDVVRELLDSPDRLRLGGERRHVTILMSDIRGFTALSESLSPEELVGLLNSHLGRMADVIIHHGGTIDEFVGDAVLAVFGAPVAHEDDAERAIRSAIAMQHAVGDVNAENRQRGLPEIAMGIAINTGDVIVGNVGSDQRMKYGIVGGHTNLTARIESFTVGGQVLISASTLREAGASVRVGRNITIRAKGFSEPIVVHELLGIGPPDSLDLPEAKEEMAHLPTAIAVRYSELEGKHVEPEQHAGRMTKLSLHGAEIRAREAPELFTNLTMRAATTGGAWVPADLYAKVVDRSPDGSWFLVRFTSVPPRLEQLLQAALSGI